jgi:hypothetical protein
MSIDARFCLRALWSCGFLHDVVSRVVEPVRPRSRFACRPDVHQPQPKGSGGDVGAPGLVR